MTKSGSSRKAPTEPSSSSSFRRPPGNIHDIDWNSLLLHKKTKKASDPQLSDVGFEAPRNSLESSPDTRTPRFSRVKHDDIPYGFEIPSEAMESPAHHHHHHHHRTSGETSGRRSQVQSIAQEPTQRRSGLSVVARLMGLETVVQGEKPSLKQSKSQQKRSSSAPGRAESSKGRAGSEEVDEDLDTIRDFPLPRASQVVDSDTLEVNSKFDMLPFRSHPQEKQLQEFKKEFMAKLAKQSHEPPQTGLDRELEERRRQLRDKVMEAKLALLGGDDSRRLSSAQEKLIESTEFQDAIELLQSVREFFVKFFQEPNSDSNKDPPEPESMGRRSFHLEDYSRSSRRSRELDDSSKDVPRKSFHCGELSRESRKSYLLDDPPKEFSRKSFHLDELSRDARRLLLQDSPLRPDNQLKESKRSSSYHHDDFSKEIRALEDYSDPQTAASRSHHRGESTKRRESRHKGAKLGAEDGSHHKSKLEVVDKEQSSWAMAPDVGRNVSPDSFDSTLSGQSSSRIVVLKPGPGDITVLAPAMDPSCSPLSSHTHRRGSRFEARESRDYRDLGRRHGDWEAQQQQPPREESRFAKDRGLERYRDPRAIAKDIVREAKINVTREISREREMGLRDPPSVGEVSLLRSSKSSGKRISSTPKSEIQEESVGSFTLAALSQVHVKEGRMRQSSPSVPTPSPRISSQETASTSCTGHKEGKRRPSEKHHHSGYQPEDMEEQFLSKGVRRIHVENSRSRFVAYSPSYIAAHRSRADQFLESQLQPDDWKGVDVSMYKSSPSREKIVKVESFHNGYGESPPRALSRCRSVPNAALGSPKSRELPTRHRNEAASDRVEYSEHFYLKQKSNEARAAYVLRRRRNRDSARAFDVPWSPTYSVSSVTTEDRTVVQEVHTISCKQVELNGVLLPEQQLAVRTRTSLEDAAPIEETPRPGVRDCEELLSALAQLTPQAKDNVEAGQLRKPSDHRLHNVQVGKQGTKGSKSWMLGSDPLENGDGASETSVEKCGQPSPVSVLDSPFEAEIPSPVEFEELTSDLQDLRLRLRLLKLNGSEKSKALLESLQAKEKLIFQLNQKGVRHTDNCLESTEEGSIPSVCGDMIVSLPPKSQALHQQLEKFSIDGLPCPEGRKSDLLYVRNLLVFSGFIEKTSSSRSIFECWSSSAFPLDPSLFDQLESCFYNDHLEKESSKPRAPTNDFESTHRRVLFEVVNEVLRKLLGPRLSSKPCLQLWNLPLVRPMATSRELLGAVWMELCASFSPEGLEEFEALDALMTRDVARGGSWINSIEAAEEIVLELESSIFDSLVEEAVHCLFSIQP